MKRVADLTVEDLRRTPVWRYQGDSDSVAVLTPTDRTALSEADRETHVAATEFILADGSRHFGFCSPGDNSGLDYLQPVILTPQGPVVFWFEELEPAVVREQWPRLGKSESEVFPVNYACKVLVDGRVVSGTIAKVESLAGAT